ncbi:hypothetical protein JTB14_013570 [Gonioctena quinquepunctata]|nr:hypothetical protein JTB14_013570 [Gonioctena quinquepunctata]
MTGKHSAGYCEKKRYLVDGKQIHYNKTKHIEFYNQNMGSVDAVDRDTKPYSPLRKSYTYLVHQGCFTSVAPDALEFKKLYIATLTANKYTKLCCYGILAKYSERYRKMKDNVKPPTSKVLHGFVDFPRKVG